MTGPDTRSYLAIDPGAESGRVIIGKLANRWLELEELIGGLKNALKARPGGKSLSVDSWGVDYVLARAEVPKAGLAVHHPDSRAWGRTSRSKRPLGKRWKKPMRSRRNSMIQFAGRGVGTVIERAARPLNPMYSRSILARWLLLLFAFVCPFHFVEGASKPNVILYVCDDWGRDAHCYGNPVLKTPNIDELARDGTRFERAYCTTASCSASRSVILSGLHNHLNGQYGHQHDAAHFSAFSSVRSLPVLLGEGGYRTARVGKFHVAPEEVFKFENVFQANPRNGVAMADSCRDWFAAKDERPFFLYICTGDPHRGGGVVAGDPAKPDSFGNNQTYKGINEASYDAKDVIVPPWLPDTAECRAEIAQYYQAVSRVDQGIGHLVQMLKELGLYENTLIMLTSDNGMAFPGSKTNLYEPGMHLPLIVRAPNQKQRGRTCDAMVSWVDITPTILGFCGVTVADAPPVGGAQEGGTGRTRAAKQKYNFHGRSWAGLWEQEKPAGWDEVYASHTFHEITMYYPMRVIETRRHKLILNIAHQLPYPFASDLWASATWQSVHRRGESHYGGRLVAQYLQRPRYELYDKEKDPQEFHNVAEDPAYAAVFKELTTKLKTFQSETRDPWVVKYEHE